MTETAWLARFRLGSSFVNVRFSPSHRLGLLSFCTKFRVKEM
jgi:hypothetical protein